MTNAPKVYIVILNWNGWKDTLECLESVSQLDYSNYQIVVCDNNSADGSYKYIREWSAGERSMTLPACNPMSRYSLPEVSKPIAITELNKVEAENPRTETSTTHLTLIQTGDNLGFAGGSNVGIRFAMNRGDCDFIWLLNNDTVVEPEALKKMVEHSTQLSQAGQPNTCGSLVCFYDEPQVIQALGGSQFNFKTGIASQTLGRFLLRTDTIDHESYAEKLAYITGCSWLLPASFITDVGLMEESYFLYYEEIDWVMRSRNKYALTYAPDSIIYHKEGRSIGSKSLNRGPSPFSDHCMALSRLKFMKRFAPRNLPIVYLAIFMQAANRIRQRQWKNAKVLLSVLLGATQYNPRS